MRENQARVAVIDFLDYTVASSAGRDMSIPFRLQSCLPFTRAGTGGLFCHGQFQRVAPFRHLRAKSLFKTGAVQG